ncbi:calcium homeostasis modulator protein 6 [Phoenicopterus ruber ruber]
MDKLRAVMDFCIRHQTGLGYSTVSLLTVAIEQIFSSVVFKCPCTSGNLLYGSAFLLAPAFILLLLGYMVNTRMWLLLTGSRSQEKCCSCSAKGICTRLHCSELALVTAKASVAPLTWIAVALLGADFYKCAASGSGLIKNRMCKGEEQKCNELLVKIPCDEKLSKNVTGEFLTLQAQSQLIGWLLIAVIMTVALISTCVSHCCSPVSYRQLKFRKMYFKKEQELFEIKAKDHATRLAERNINCFFEATRPESFQTPSNEDWKKISLLYTSSSEKQYHSMIHKFVNTDRGTSARFNEGDRNPLGLGCVDEANADESGF